MDDETGEPARVEDPSSGSPVAAAASSSGVDAEELMVDSSDAGKESGEEPPEEKMKQYVNLFEHAYACRSVTCGLTNCAEMKKHIKHAKVCRTKIQGGCRVCKRIWKLLRAHAQSCKDSEKCPVPQCRTIKQKMTGLQDFRQSVSSPIAQSAILREGFRSQEPQQQQQQQQQQDPLWLVRMKLVEHATRCSKSDCSFPGCAHTKKCLLRRRSKPGMTAGQGGCRTCQGIWASLQANQPPVSQQGPPTQAQPISRMQDQGQRLETAAYQYSDGSSALPDQKSPAAKPSKPPPQERRKEPPTTE